MDSPQQHPNHRPPFPDANLDTALGRAVQACPSYSSGPAYQSLLLLTKHRNITLPSPWLGYDYPGNFQAMIKLLRKVEEPPRSLYFTHTVVQLKILLKERGLKPGPVRLKRAYVQKLINDDKENPKPFRFSDLPPEIRVDVYKLVLNETSKLTPTSYAPELIAEPALLQVSTTVRQETLPIYYGNNHFCMLLKSPPDSFFDTTATPTICPDTLKWLENLGEPRLNMLRKISIEIRYLQRMMILNIEMSAKKNEAECTVDRTCQYHHVGSGHCRRWKESKSLEKVLESQIDDGRAVVRTGCLDEMNVMVIKGELTLERFKEMLLEVGDMLWGLKHSMK